MKKYMTPEVELLALCAKEAIMASSDGLENETDRDIIIADLSIKDVGNI